MCVSHYVKICFPEGDTIVISSCVLFWTRASVNVLPLSIRSEENDASHF